MSKVPPEHEYFFAVGSPGTVMSCVWHIWTWPNRRDVYITEQGSLHSFHASLHKDDKCHITFTNEFIVEQRKHGTLTFTNRNRKTHEWTTTEIMEGVQLPFRLLIPASELRPSAPGWSTQKQVVWLPTPPSNFAYEVRLYRMCKGFTVHSPDGDIGLLWQRPLVDGWELAVLAKLGFFPDAERQKVEYARLQARAALPTSVPKHGRLRVINQGFADDGSRHFIDMALDVPTS